MTYDWKLQILLEKFSEGHSDPPLGTGAVVVISDGYPFEDVPSWGNCVGQGGTASFGMGGGQLELECNALLVSLCNVDPPLGPVGVGQGSRILHCFLLGLSMLLCCWDQYYCDDSVHSVSSGAYYHCVLSDSDSGSSVDSA